MTKRSRIAIELEEREKQMNADKQAEIPGVAGKKRRGSGRVRGYLKDQLVKRTSTKR